MMINSIGTMPVVIVVIIVMIMINYYCGMMVSTIISVVMVGMVNTE